MKALRAPLIIKKHVKCAVLDGKNMIKRILASSLFGCLTFLMYEKTANPSTEDSNIQCDIVWKDGKITKYKNKIALKDAKADCEKYYCGPQGGDHCDNCVLETTKEELHICNGHMECTGPNKETGSCNAVNEEHKGYNPTDAKVVCLSVCANSKGTGWDCKASDGKNGEKAVVCVKK